jgi:hypothetical protein
MLNMAVYVLTARPFGLSMKMSSKLNKLPTDFFHVRKESSKIVFGTNI